MHIVGQLCIVDLYLSVSERSPTATWEEIWLGSIRYRAQSTCIPNLMESLLLYHKDLPS